MLSVIRLVSQIFGKKLINRIESLTSRRHKKEDITLSFPGCQAQNKFISQYKEMSYNKTLFFVGGHSLYLTHDPSRLIMLLALPWE